MAKFRYQHIKSSVEGKAPTAEQIKVAEIGVNDFAGDEKLFIKNSAGEVVDFPRGYSQTVIDENERVTAEALNYLNTNKLDASAYTPTDLSNYYTKDETSGKTEIQNALDEKADTATTLAGYGITDAYTKDETSGASEIQDALDDKADTATTLAGYGITDAYTKDEIDNTELAIAESLNDLNSRKLDASAYTPTDLSDYYKKSEVDARDLWVSGTGINSAALKGGNNTASGNYSVAEGSGTTASSNFSHSEGQGASARGLASHAEGAGTIASGGNSHAEGGGSQAFANASHAEGSGTKASGDSSHAEGISTITSNAAEHASGKHNVSLSASSEFGDAGNTLFSVGNGTADNARHNAFEIRQNGDIYFTSGGTDVKLQDSIPAVDGYADSVKYNSTTHYVEFYHGTTAGTKVFEYDASPFLIDGMVEDVEIEDVEISGETVTCLVISFNTAAGKQDINIPLSDIFDPSNYYTKSETSGATEIQNALDGKSDTGHTHDDRYYTEIEIDNLLAGKVSTSDIDQVIDDTTSASTGAVSTSAVYGFVTSYTPSITVDQVLDDTTSASTNPVSSKAVYDVIVDNEYVWANAYAAMSGAISSHTVDTDIHVTSADKDNWDAKLDASAYTPTDLTNYYTKSETSGATEISTALADKADTATTYTKTEVDERDLWVGGIGTVSVAQKGGNNTASGLYSHAEGRYTKASGDSSHSEGWTTTAGGEYSHAEGNNTIASGDSSHAEGRWTKANGGHGSHAEGYYAIASGTSSHAEGQWTRANGDYSHAEGYTTIANNQSEHASGQYNVSSKASSTFGDSGNTLFSVGNGTADNAKHNAFEIRQNGDIYIASGNSDIKLQDYIGSVETVTAITPSNSGSTEPIATKVVAENELVMANALNDLESRKLDASAYTTTSAVTSGSTDVITSGGVYAQMDGIKLKKITQSAYDALVQAGTVDANTLYVITD